MVSFLLRTAATLLLGELVIVAVVEHDTEDGASASPSFSLVDPSSDARDALPPWLLTDHHGVAQGNCPHITWHQCTDLLSGPSQHRQDLFDAMELAETQSQFCNEIEDTMSDWLYSEQPFWEYQWHDDNFQGATLGSNPALHVGIRTDRFNNLWNLRNTMFHEAGHLLYGENSEFMAQVAEECAVQS